MLTERVVVKAKVRVRVEAKVKAKAKALEVEVEARMETSNSKVPTVWYLNKTPQTARHSTPKRLPRFTRACSSSPAA